MLQNNNSCWSLTYIFSGLKDSSNFLSDEIYRRHWFSLYQNRKVYTFFSQELSRLSSFLKFFYIYLTPTWVDDSNRELEAWTQERCDQTSAYIKDGLAAKDQDPGNEPVVFSSLLAGIEKEKKTKGQESVLKNETLKYPELSIASEMIDHLAAGHETAGITLTYISWYLSQDLELQNLLRAELLTLLPNMQLSSSSPQIPNSKALDALPLLHAVIMETLRTNAAIPGNQPRMTPYPSCTLGDFKDIPGGVRVGASAYSLHKREQVFAEAEKWNYRRWMDGDNNYSEEEKKDRDRWFWAFSSGGRMCVGSNFAMHGMSYEEMSGRNGY